MSPTTGILSTGLPRGCGPWRTAQCGISAAVIRNTGPILEHEKAARQAQSAEKREKKEKKERPRTPDKQLDKQVRRLERQIAQQEAQLAELEAQIQEAAADYQKLSALLEEKAQADETLLALMEAWETAAMALEEG